MDRKQPLHTFTNDETGMEAYVYASDRGGFNVTLRDLDSGLMVPTGLVGIKDESKAIETARRWAGV